MEHIHEFVNREVISDGRFLYNIGYQLKWINNYCRKCYYDAVLIGVIEGAASIELPEYFLGKKLSCINSIKVYKKGNQFTLGNEPFVSVPLAQRPKVWYFFEGTLPKSDWLQEVPNEIRSFAFHKTPIKSGAFANSGVETVLFKQSPPIIPEKCFLNSKYLKRCDLMDGLKKIGYSAFNGCTSLKYIHLPSTVANICEYSFYNTGLEMIIIPNQVTRIKKGTFEKCLNLQMVIVSPNVQYIHPLAFKDSPGVNIIAVSGSPAAKYAYDKGLPFIPLEDLAKIAGAVF